MHQIDLAESADRELEGADFGPGRKMPSSPPETARAGGLWLEAETRVRRNNQRDSVPFGQEPIRSTGSRSTTRCVTGGSA